MALYGKPVLFHATSVFDIVGFGESVKSKLIIVILKEQKWFHAWVLA